MAECFRKPQENGLHICKSKVTLFRELQDRLGGQRTFKRRTSTAIRIAFLAQPTMWHRLASKHCLRRQRVPLRSRATLRPSKTRTRERSPMLTRTRRKPRKDGQDDMRMSVCGADATASERVLHRYVAYAESACLHHGGRNGASEPGWCF